MFDKTRRIVKLGRKGQTSNSDIYRKPQREGEVRGHRRLALSVWNLVGKALHAVRHGEEVPEIQAEESEKEDGTAE